MPDAPPDEVVDPAVFVIGVLVIVTLVTLGVVVLLVVE